LEQEQRRFSDLSASQIVLEIPASLQNRAVMVRLTPEIACAETAVFSRAQAYLAAEAAARYVIPYVNRMTRYSGRGLSLLQEIPVALSGSGRRVELLAAGLRDTAEVLACLAAGADHVTLALVLIREMADHPLSAEAIQECANLSE
jgi:transaldolase